MFPLPDEAGLLIPATAALVQGNEVDDTSLEGVYVKFALLQMEAGVKVLVNCGVGVTITTIFCVFEHPFAVKV